MPKLKKTKKVASEELTEKRQKLSDKNSTEVHNHKSIYVTAKGLEEAKRELSYLTITRRKEVADRIQSARELGDLSENSEYDSAMEEQALVENRIAELENMLTGIQIISENIHNDFVVIGSTITIEMDGEVDEFTIVGRLEADPSKKLISNESPLGSALLGAKIGEEVEVATPIVRYKCKILAIK